ncbi:MAG: zinc ribbon domain-containing protein [bacterium]|nr:zinc ribbon domain-containing protein [bacterium]
MPTYDYICTQCGSRFEAFQSIKAAPKAQCPKCGSPGKRQIGTGIGVIFKGTGFYQTDYKRKETGGGSSKAKSKPSGSKPAETKPSESRASESKSAEPKASDSGTSGAKG